MPNPIRKSIFDEIISAIFDPESNVVVSADFIEPAEVTPRTRLTELLDPFNLQRLLIRLELFFSIRIEDSEIFQSPVFNGLPSYCQYGEETLLTKNFGELTSLVASKI